MKPKKIVLIDDSEIDNYINKAIIKKVGDELEILSFTSGIEALEYLEELQNDLGEFPDFIFLDIRMPEMDGFEFLDEYIKLPEKVKDKCNVFILSSSLDPIDKEKTKQYKDVQKHLTKPLVHHPIEKFILGE
ncbi:CheY-like chemotaxis protein [Saonia flava]|uniref:CheY-like chemotaxis protein n=1 Tax=Saonia flava TaxID=523696 RepID=A0A846R3Q6_9FLAO|nr:response regulator [Saonia flava]NJB71449.1 CheY-like chemotaxis protein [Saonia flava]